MLMLLYFMVIVGVWSLGMDDFECDPSTQIRGGQNLSDIRERPYMTAILECSNDTSCTLESRQRECADLCDGFWYVCSGSLLSPHYVLTAAHCFWNHSSNDDSGFNNSGISTYISRAIEKFRFLSGSIYATRLHWQGSAQLRSASDIFFHPSYMPFKHDPSLSNMTVHLFSTEDVSIAKMDRIFVVNEYIQPVKLFSYDNLAKYVDDYKSMLLQSPVCDVSGWGSRLEETTPSSVEDHDKDPPLALRTCKTVIISDLECNTTIVVWKNRTILDVDHPADQIICTSGSPEPDGSCFGDSGSPLVCDGYQVGIVETSSVCGILPQPCTNLLTLVDWLANQFCVNRDCSDIFGTGTATIQSPSPTSHLSPVPYNTSTLYIDTSVRWVTPLKSSSAVVGSHKLQVSLIVVFTLNLLHLFCRFTFFVWQR